MNKKATSLILCALLGTGKGIAEPKKMHEEGKALAQSLLRKSGQAVSTSDPFFQAQKAKSAGVSMGEGFASGEAGLSEQAHRQMAADKNNVGNFVLETEKDRSRFEDIESSAMFLRAESITHDPKSVMEVVKNKYQDCVKVPIDTDEVVSKALRFCEISRKPEIETCEEYLKLPSVKVTPAKYSHYWCTSGNHRPDDSRCLAKQYYPTARIYQAKVVTVSPDVWVSECAALESRSECTRTKTECIEGPSTKTIEEQPIHKPCWRKRHTYSCQYPITKDKRCEPFRKAGCEAIGSKCILTARDKCYKWEQTYECPKKKATTEPKYKLVCGKNTFCLEGECEHLAEDPNKEMAEAISKLLALKQMVDELPKTRKTISEIFKGEGKGCKIYSIGRNCCDMKGFLKKSCDDESKYVNERRAKGFCHEVGTYYVEKSILKDRRKKTNYCCFSSKLARAIHEQGRSQLGVGWGDAKRPNCRGLTPDELSRIDFNRMDFSFLYADIQRRQKNVDVSQIQRNLEDKMRQIQRGIKPMGEADEAP